METKAKKKLFNTIMVILIVVVVGCGIMAVGNLKGWFGKNSESPIVSEEITGVVNLERSSVGYSLEKDVPIKGKDIIESRNTSEASFAVGSKTHFALGGKTEVKIDKCQPEDISITLNKGEVFVDSPKAENMTFAFGSNKVAPGEAVLSLSAQNNSGEVMVFKGEVDVETLNDGTVTLKEGQQLTISNDTEGKAETETSDIKVTSLNEFQIKKMQSCSGDLCFTTAQLDKVVKDRKAEQEKQAKALEKEALAVVTKEQGGEQTTSKVMSCTIQIQCRTILDNMDKLKDGKGGYVPSNGVILATSRVEFQQGESAYDVTKRACNAAGIQMEASYSPVYGGYYVEGINHLYEFDCGTTSGWLYSINGWQPNYGCSEYTLKDGDSIVWSYTCSRK